MPNTLLLLPALGGEIQSLGAWPYFALVLLVALEGPLATLAAAVACSTGYLDPRLVFLSASFGNLSADVLWFSLGYLGRMDLVVHYGGWLGIREENIMRLKQGMHDHVGKFLFVAKLTLGLVVPTLIAAGLAHVPWKRWFGMLFLAECLWTGSLVLAGYYYGQYVLHLENDLKWISIGASVILVIAAVAFFLRQRANKDNQ